LSGEKYAEKQGSGLFPPGFSCIIVADSFEPGEAGWTKQKLLYTFSQSFRESNGRQPLRASQRFAAGFSGRQTNGKGEEILHNGA
jgi:hypothetical protein